VSRIKNIISELLYAIGDEVEAFGEDDEEEEEEQGQGKHDLTFLGLILCAPAEIIDNIEGDVEKVFKGCIVSKKKSRKLLRIQENGEEEKTIQIDGRTFSIKDVEQITKKWVQDGIIR